MVSDLLSLVSLSPLGWTRTIISTNPATELSEKVNYSPGKISGIIILQQSYYSILTLIGKEALTSNHINHKQGKLSLPSACHSIVFLFVEKWNLLGDTDLLKT